MDDVDSTPDADIPLAARWPPDPTFGDRAKASALFYIALVAGGVTSFVILLNSAPLVSRGSAAGLSIRSSAATGSGIAAVFFGLIIGFAAIRWRLSRRFSDRRDRLIFEHMLRRHATRDQAEQFADSYGVRDTFVRVLVLLLLFLLGLYCWLAWSAMHIRVDGNTIGWRTFSLASHERPVADISAIYLTKVPGGGFKRSDRPCIVVQFADRTEIRSNELSPTGDECDRVALALSRASGRPITPVPWLDYVPKPK